MKKVFGWGLILFALAACSNLQPVDEPVAESQQPVILTATIHAGVPTKVLTEATDGIAAEWVVGEQVALIYEASGQKKKVDAVVTSVDPSTKAATIYAELTGTLTEGDQITTTLIYPASAVSNYSPYDMLDVLKSQDGTFGSISTYLDVRTGTGTLLIGSDNKANLKKDVTLDTQYSIFKFTLTNAVGGNLASTSLVVTINGKTYTITPSDASDVMYAVLPPIDKKAVSFKATSSGVNYYFSNPSVSFAAGEYYEPTLALSDDFGLLPGVFSVSGSKKVQFSKGNLQWFYGENAHLVDQSSYVSPGTQNQYHFNGGVFTFADHQYEICADNNYGNDRGSDRIESNKGNYDADKRIDLFMYATSGYKSTKNMSDNQTYHYKPFAIYRGDAYESIQNPVNLEFGPQFGMTGSADYKKSDWGVFNAILNGGDETGMWRTLTYQEWTYLLNTRSNASEKVGVGIVNGCHGVIILPDSWTLPGGLNFTPISAVDGNTDVSVIPDNKSLNYNWSDNDYSTADWALMEAAGAVFLPAAGAKQMDTDGTVKGDNDGSNEAYVISYWTASTSLDGSTVSREYAYALDLGQESASTKNWRFDKSNRAFGRAVRLVSDVH